MTGRIKLKGSVKKMHGFHSVSPVNSYKLELQRAWQRGEAADDLILTNCSFWAREKTGASAGRGAQGWLSRRRRFCFRACPGHQEKCPVVLLTQPATAPLAAPP